MASGDLSLDDLPAVTTTVVTDQAPVGDDPATDGDPTDEVPTDDEPTGPDETLAGQVAIPGDLSPSFAVSSGIATYSVPEILRGLSTQGVGESTGVAGTIELGGSFAFSLDMLSFTSDQSRRDSRVREWFSQFPEATFSGDSFDLPSTAIVGEAQTFDITGTLTVNGISLPTVWQIQARVEADGSISIQGETDIVLSDFDVPVLTGTITMEDSGHLEILVSAVPAL